MSNTRNVEVFSAGCPVCDDVVQLVQRIACPSCSVTVHAMSNSVVAAKAKDLGVRSLPAVVVNGKLADCCAGRGPDEATLRAAGVGQPIS